MSPAASYQFVVPLAADQGIRAAAPMQAIVTPSAVQRGRHFDSTGDADVVVAVLAVHHQGRDATERQPGSVQFDLDLVSGAARGDENKIGAGCPADDQLAILKGNGDDRDCVRDRRFLPPSLSVAVT